MGWEVAGTKEQVPESPPRNFERPRAENKLPIGKVGDVGRAIADCAVRNPTAGDDLKVTGRRRAGRATYGQTVKSKQKPGSVAHFLLLGTWYFASARPL